METPTVVQFLCHFCNCGFPTAEGLSRHLQMKTKCARMLVALEMARGTETETETEEEPAEGRSNGSCLGLETVDRAQIDETASEEGGDPDPIPDAMDEEDGDFEPE